MPVLLLPTLPGRLNSQSMEDSAFPGGALERDTKGDQNLSGQVENLTYSRLQHLPAIRTC